MRRAQERRRRRNSEQVGLAGHRISSSSLGPGIYRWYHGHLQRICLDSVSWTVSKLACSITKGHPCSITANTRLCQGAGRFEWPSLSVHTLCVEPSGSNNRKHLPTTDPGFIQNVPSSERQLNQQAKTVVILVSARRHERIIRARDAPSQSRAAPTPDTFCRLCRTGPSHRRDLQANKRLEPLLGSAATSHRTALASMLQVIAV